MLQRHCIDPPANSPCPQVVLERGTEWLEHKWSQRRGQARSNGLLTMLTFIKQELFMLGLISMLLTAVQDPMLRIWWVGLYNKWIMGKLLRRVGGTHGPCCAASTSPSRV